MSRLIPLVMSISMAISGCVNLPPSPESEQVRQLIESIKKEEDVLTFGSAFWFPNQDGSAQFSRSPFDPRPVMRAGVFVLTKDEVLYYLKSQRSGALKFARRIPLSTVVSVEVRPGAYKCLVISSATGLDSFAIHGERGTRGYAGVEPAAELVSSLTGKEVKVH